MKYWEDLQIGETFTAGPRSVSKGEIIALEPSRSRPQLGSARMRYQLENQNGEIVLRMIGIGLIARRR